jgi:hypothetical protein
MVVPASMLCCDCCIVKKQSYGKKRRNSANTSDCDDRRLETACEEGGHRQKETQQAKHGANLDTNKSTELYFSIGHSEK